MEEKIPIAETSKLNLKSSVLKDKEEKVVKDFDPTISSMDEAISPGFMMTLSKPDVDMWKVDRDTLLNYIELMFYDLKIVNHWRIQGVTLRLFLVRIREHYRNNPYHNFQHCFCVVQMTYSIIKQLKLDVKLNVDDIGALLTAALCHDVDHPGLNNTYQKNAKSSLAFLYSNNNILENHHFAVTCNILSSKETNIFRNVKNSHSILCKIRELIISTDLVLHGEIMLKNASNFENGFNYDNQDHVLGLLKVVIKCADISNEVRPEHIAKPWVKKLFEEYSLQYSRETLENLPQSSYMNTEKVNVTDSQIHFIESFILPMYKELSKVNEDAITIFIKPLKESLHRYKAALEIDKQK